MWQRLKALKIKFVGKNNCMRPAKKKKKKKGMDACRESFISKFTDHPGHSGNKMPSAPP